MISSDIKTSNMEADYELVLASIRERFEALIGNPAIHLFTTDVTGLYDTYLSNLLPENRQYHSCHACRDFIERYGGLVYINREGILRTAIWDINFEGLTGNYYRAAIAAMGSRAEDARVNGFFFTSENTWGKSVSEDRKREKRWTHFAIEPPARLVHNSPVWTAYQHAAERKSDYINVTRALAEFDTETVNKAIAILESDAMYRSEKVLGPAKFLGELHARRNATKDHRRHENFTWLAVAKAPAGFCHPKASIIGSLLEDIASGMQFEDTYGSGHGQMGIRSRFAMKMDPLKYQRPQAAPAAATVKQAEELVAKLGIASSLRRRFATLAEIPKIWEPAPESSPTESTGIFGHLKTKDLAPIAVALEIPMQDITWVKFREKILPEVISMEFFVPYMRHNYVAILTAADASAPPILQWDSPEQRNPFSWYVYHKGSMPSSWNLNISSFVRVNAIVEKPHVWFRDKPLAHQVAGVIFILQGARDSAYAEIGNALFPENLRSELHVVRSVIEAYSKNAVIEGHDASDANGIALTSGHKPIALMKFKVKLKNGTTAHYSFDRWD